MAALTLPSTPAPRMLMARLVPPPRELRSPTGEGPLQRIAGFQRWIVDFELPPMTYVEAMAWVDLFDATNTVVLPIHEPGLVKPNYGTPMVKGAGQSGSALDADGVQNNQIIKGKWLSIITAGRRYLYHVRSSVTPVGGEVELPLRPLLRASPADNDVIELATPKIEGFPAFEGGPVTADRLVHGLKFSIEEVR